MDVTKSRTADPTRIRADVVVIAVADPPGTPTGPLAAVCDALRIANQPTKAEALP